MVLLAGVATVAWGLKTNPPHGASTNTTSKPRLDADTKRLAGYLIIAVLFVGSYRLVGCSSPYQPLSYTVGSLFGATVAFLGLSAVVWYFMIAKR